MKLVPFELFRVFKIHLENQFSGFVLKGSNPYALNFKKIKLRIFLKNLSPAYFKNKDITRIQVAKMAAFEKIKNNNEICIPIGYDSINKTYVVWNPYIFIDRINEKENISLYSRKSKQEEVKDSNYLPFVLKNEETVFAVNSKYISDFIHDIDSFFHYTNFISQPDFIENKDNLLILEINKFIVQKDFIGAVLYCLKNKNEKYPKRGIKEWKKELKPYFEEIL